MTQLPRILVCGGRDYSDRLKVHQKLDDLCADRGWTTLRDEYGNCLNEVFVIAGKARGVDTFAVDWAVINWCDFKEFPADWKTHGKAAGVIRNQQILDEGKPDLVVAFPGGRGTSDMIRRAEKAGIPVIRMT